jgi:hypothetical protein
MKRTHWKLAGTSLTPIIVQVDRSLETARALVARLEEEPNTNPNTGPRSSRSAIRTATTSRSVRCEFYTRRLGSHISDTVLPRESRSLRRAPRVRSIRTIWIWASRLSGRPDPPRPVSSTARCKGVEPEPFLKRESAPLSNSTSTALVHLQRTARWMGATPLLSTASGSAPA